METESTSTPSQRSQGITATQRVAGELNRVEAFERWRLGLPPRSAPQWVEPVHDRFDRHERESTTILLFGLTRNHDLLIGAAMRSLGYRVQVLDIPDSEAHEIGRAFCDRSMCNPTYYTVGHLLRFLRRLRDEDGLSEQEIIGRYVLVTPNGCGPCRFTLYVNEYRKALRDAGFEGFRVLLFNQRLIDRQNGPDAGIQFDARLMFHLVRAIIVADILNLHTWRTRPYERIPGDTEAAIARCRERLETALERNKGLLAALWNVRKELASVSVDRTGIRPKVGIMGEFWAQTTEGDGNYRLQQFLESEGAEVEAQTLIAWILLLQWELVHDTSLRAGLPDSRVAMRTESPVRTWFNLAVIHGLVAVIHLTVRLFSRLAGLRGFKLARLRRLARQTQAFYDVSMRGGEMFSEVGKMLDYAAHENAHLVVSVKPFGCMPSSAVSDGVQSLVSERNPHIGFLSIETTGDSAVNVYSRLQMQLFKAKRQAEREAERVLARYRTHADEVREYLRRHPRLAGALHRSRHLCACTAANLFHEIARRPRFLLWRGWRYLTAKSERQSATAGRDKLSSLP